MFKIISVAAFYINFNLISTQLATEWFVPEENPFEMPPDWTNIITSLNSFKDSSNKQDLLTNLISILKTALCEEFEQVPCTTIENTENMKPVIITCVEENSNNIINTSTTIEKGGKITKMELKEMLAQIASNKSKSTKPDSQFSKDVPSMIPIFKPKISNPQKENGEISNNEVPEKVSPIPNAAAFNIPCQRTSDILDGSYLIPKVTETFKSKPNPIAQVVKSNLQCEKPSSYLSKNSISCVESDDVVAMLFKPKTISMMQVYGNLLKKISITVLVPFYVSKMTL